MNSNLLDSINPEKAKCGRCEKYFDKSSLKETVVYNELVVECPKLVVECPSCYTVESCYRVPVPGSNGQYGYTDNAGRLW